MLLSDALLTVSLLHAVTAVAGTTAFYYADTKDEKTLCKTRAIGCPLNLGQACYRRMERQKGLPTYVSVSSNTKSAPKLLGLAAEYYPDGLPIKFLGTFPLETCQQLPLGSASLMSIKREVDPLNRYFPPELVDEVKKYNREVYALPKVKMVDAMVFAVKGKWYKETKRPDPDAVKRKLDQASKERNNDLVDKLHSQLSNAKQALTNYEVELFADFGNLRLSDEAFLADKKDPKTGKVVRAFVQIPNTPSSTLDKALDSLYSAWAPIWGQAAAAGKQIPILRGFLSAPRS